MKKFLPSIGYLSLAALLSACAPGGSAIYSDDTTFNGTEYYDKVETRVGFDETYEGNIDETLEGGTLNDDYWNALSGVWQNDSAAKPHNGVQTRNLFYVKDGDDTYLGFRGRGLYNQDSDMNKNSEGQVLPEGACLITKNKLAPGRYEIEMAAFPRHGGVSAAWTYLSETGNEATSQNEIDIEIGGDTSGDTFGTFWATSWTTHSNKQTVDVDVTPILYMNDGKFHKYTFDWYTSYLDTNLGRVDWFIDGILIASVKGSLVTDIMMPMWIGLWFPNWTNNAVFDTDYMLMKSFMYKAFDTTQPYQESRSGIGYTQVDPSAANIGSIEYEDVKNINKIANGGFETYDQVPLNSTHYGWEEMETNRGTVALSSDAKTGSHSLSLKAGTEGNAYTRQTIEETFENYQFDLSFAGKLATSDSAGKAEIHFTNRLGVDVGTAITINLDSTDWKTYSQTITVPEKTKSMQVRLYGTAGESLIDDVDLKFKGIVG